MAKFVIQKNYKGYSFFLEGDDAVVIGNSDYYTVPATARKGIDSLKVNSKRCHLEDQTIDGWKSLRNPKFEIFYDGNKKLRFRMKALNGQNLMTSVPYRSMTELISAIEYIRDNAATAKVEG